MSTFLTDSPHEAARYVKLGGIAAFPTETVYGLGANVFDQAAVTKIFAAKGRPADNPLIAHVADLVQIQLLVSEITPVAEKLIAAFFPAPLTIVLRKSQNVPLIATAGLETIGVRMPQHELACEFIRACNAPLVAPSANLSGKPSPTTWQAVFEDLNGKIDCILQGEQTRVGLESTVVDCTGDAPIVLRAGAVTIEDLQKIIPEAKLVDDNSAEKMRSPGTRYKHYAPRARVMLINTFESIKFTGNSAFIGINKRPEKFRMQKICCSVEEYAHELFAFFRDCDAQRIETIFCETVVETSYGLALMDRLQRAAN